MPRYVSAPSWVLAALVGVTLCLVLTAFICGNQQIRVGAESPSAAAIAATQASR